MKNILLAICCVNSLSVCAQNGVYLKPGIGFGMGDVFTNVDRYDHVSGIFSYNAQLGAGYQRNKWRLESGIQYYTTGLATKIVWIEPVTPQLGPVGRGTTYSTYTFTHIALPLSVGYKISIAKKWSIVPMVGVMAGYNLKYNIYDEANIYKSIDYSTYGFEGDHKMYKRINAWGNAAINIEYQASKRLSITAGVQSMRMLNSMFSKSWFCYTRYQQYNYSATLNFGVKWDLGKVTNKTTAIVD